MALQTPRYSLTTISEYSNTAEKQESDLKQLCKDDRDPQKVNEELLC